MGARSRSEARKRFGFLGPPSFEPAPPPSLFLLHSTFFLRWPRKRPPLVIPAFASIWPFRVPQ